MSAERVLGRLEETSGSSSNNNTDSMLAALTSEQLDLGGQAAAGESQASGVANLTPSASSILRVLLPSLTKLDCLLESVWSKQDSLNEVLDRLNSELELFDELILPPGISPHSLPPGSTASSSSLATSSKSVTLGQQAAARLKESRTRIAGINATLKKVRSRLDSISMLAQAKLLQQQKEQHGSAASRQH
ncbi:hypothetical protein GGI12_001719 [Dipsacomyces acuminosporus]|nr:hypothetical protein GGI12_001719 [Dipsacomyces acuminosporus]